MNKIMAIAQREIQERAFVFVVAAAITAAPFLSLLVRDATFAQRLEIARIIGVIVAVAFALGLSVLLGVSIVGREAREKRLSFYFARPIGGSAIWYGKMIAAVLLIAGCAAIMFAPTLGLKQGGWRSFWTIDLPSFIALSLASAFVLLLVTHTTSTMLRSRSMLVVVDFIAAIAFIAVVAYLLLGIAIHGAPDLLEVLGVSLIVIVVATLFFGGAWHLSRGRIDPKRGHRQLSLFTWSCLGMAAIVLFAVTMWIKAVNVSDLTHKYAQQTHDGAALIVEGTARHRLDYRTHFLTDVATGRTLPVSDAMRWGVITSGDGRKAAWLEPDVITLLMASLGDQRSKVRSRLMTATLGTAGKASDTAIDVAGQPDAIALSHDGARVAVMTAGTITVYDLDTRRSLGSAHIPEHSWWEARLQFVTPEDVRLFVRPRDAKGGGFLAGYDFQLRQRSLRQILTTAHVSLGWMQYEPSADGTRLLARVNRGGKVGSPPLITIIVWDLATGRQLFEITPPAGQSISGAWMFADHRTAVLMRRTDGQANRLAVQLFDPAGAPLRTIDAGPGVRGIIEGEVAPGVLAIVHTTAPWGGKQKDPAWTLSRLDTNTGSAAPIADEVRPVVMFPFGIGTTPRTMIPSRVFADVKQENFFAIDLRTGARRRLI